MFDTIPVEGDEKTHLCFISLDNTLATRFADDEYIDSRHICYSQSFSE